MWSGNKPLPIIKEGEKDMKEEIRVSSRLDKLALWYDYTIVCDNIRSAVVEHYEDGRAKWGVELTNPVEYTKEELLNKYEGKTKIYRWVHTYTENGQPAMAVVIE